MTDMNTGWSGPPPRRVAQARHAAASLLSASVEAVLVTRNTTEGLNIVLSGLNWNPGDEIITCNLEHGSVMVPPLMLGEHNCPGDVGAVGSNTDAGRQAIRSKAARGPLERNGRAEHRVKRPLKQGDFLGNPLASRRKASAALVQSIPSGVSALY